MLPPKKYAWSGIHAWVRKSPDSAGSGPGIDTIAPATGARFSLLPPENATGNYVKVVQRVPVKIVLDEPNTGHLLRPGMSVLAKVWVK